MRRVVLASLLCAACDAPAQPRARGVLLETLTWQAAERVLHPDAVVVLPLGAAAKEHGPHLPLNNDFLLAEHLKQRVLARADVVVAPTLGYHYYPAFIEYAGSTTLSQDAARAVVVDIVRSLAAHGPRRFYVLNTGISTVRALAPAAEQLAAEGIVLHYTDLARALAPIEAELRQQEGGTHADEIETSMMLYLAPEVVDMTKAVKDFNKKGESGLSRDPTSRKTYSPTGTWGDPTLATREKGERVVTALVDAIVQDLETLKSTPVPQPTPPSP